PGFFPPMNLETPNELFLEGVARGVERMLAAPEFTDRLAEAVAEKIALRFELLEPAAAAALLDVTAKTLNANHVDWSLDKSVAFGLTNPRFFLTQIVERAKAKVICGKILKSRNPEILKSERRAA
ncbi:MAG TPA: hypothetical protein VHW03_10100, partial [Chthoniobacterales bacterium]|nr:hypothetical protein [Chthoniobacterales bacterium]